MLGSLSSFVTPAQREGGRKVGLSGGEQRGVREGARGCFKAPYNERARGGGRVHEASGS